MSTENFPRTIRSLLRGRSSIPPIAVISLTFALVVWLGWFTQAKLKVYAVSQTARVSVRSEPHRIQTAVEATVLEVLTGLGKTVKRGDLLFRLDPQRVAGQLVELRALAGSLDQELRQLQRRTSEDQSALENEGDARLATTQEGEARLGEAREAHALALADYRRVETLHRQGLASDADLERAQLETVSKHAALLSAQAASGRLKSEGQMAVADRRSLLARGSQEHDSLAGRLLQTRATIERLEMEQGLFDIRSPVDGQVAALGAVRAGSVALRGDTLATVVPDDELKVVASFAPVEALGRVRPGQPAWLRLDGFPWTRFGAVRATVESVASESADGTVTVELAITEEPEAIPLQHGLPGQIEIEVETATPAELVLRAAGRTSKSASRTSASSGSGSP